MTEVQALCADLCLKIPQADKSGLFEKDGVCYGTRKALARAFGMEHTTVRSRVKSSSIQSIKGRTKGGAMRDFYPEPAVREVCADLIEKRKKRNSKRS